MKKLVITLIAIALIVPAVGAAKKKEKDITGTYWLKGYDPGAPTSGDPNYTGRLTITQSGGAYALNWNVKKSGKQNNYKGVGIYTDGILSASFGKGGVASYKVEKETMKGVWAPSTGGIFGYEICEKTE